MLFPSTFISFLLPDCLFELKVFEPIHLPWNPRNSAPSASRPVPSPRSPGDVGDHTLHHSLLQNGPTSGTFHMPEPIARCRYARFLS